MPRKPAKDWMWRRLLASPAGLKPALNYRRPDYMLNKQGQTVRFHVPHPTTPAVERFIAMTERVLIRDDYCVIWRGGDTFRVDDDLVTTPARFYWEIMTGERLNK